MKKKVLSIFLALTMMLTIIPAMSFAASAEEGPEPVWYIERTWDGEKVVETEKECTDYVYVDDTTSAFEDGKWYVITGDVICGSITTSGNANLILCDGSSLTVNGSIYVPTSETLNIYGQSVGDGVLSANAADYDAGIGGGDEGNGGTVTIYGGTVNATGGDSAAGIGGGYNGNGGTVTIYGGTVNANGGRYGAGIGGGISAIGGNVAIYGGTVTATGGKNYAGIGGRVGKNNGTLSVAENAVIKAGDEAPALKMTVDEYMQNRNNYVNIYFPVPGPMKPVTYIDRSWNDEKQTVEETERECTDYIVIDESDTTLNNGKWYVVKGDIILDHRLVVNGTTNLIITDGSRLTITKSIYLPEGNLLNIYGQSADSGILSVAGNLSAGIGTKTGNCGDVAVYGGIVTATGTTGRAGIGGGSQGNGGNVSIYGGTVSAFGGESAAGIGGGLQGNGGTVSIYGGTVTATAGQNAVAIGAGSDGTTDGTLTVAENAVIKAGDEAPGDDTTIEEYIQNRNKYVSIIVPREPIKYIDRTWDGEKVVETERDCTIYIIIDESTETFENGKWYVATGNFTNDNRITVNGTANLIICDDCNFESGTGISVNEGNTLNIYGQSADSGKLNAISGNLFYCYGAGIGGGAYGEGGNVVIYGGTINATGGARASGIGSYGDNSNGTVTIYGGIINATAGAEAAAIGGGSGGNGGTVTVYGGTVTANSSSGYFGAGIGGGNGCNGGTVIINGGTVNAFSKYGAGIGGGNGGNGGTVTINGGTVVALTCGIESAAIGGGEGFEDHGPLTIKDGMFIKAGNAAPGTQTTAEEYLQNRSKYVLITTHEQVSSVKYIDRTWNGNEVIESEKECEDFVPVYPSTTTFEDGKWYVIENNVENGERIKVSGNANLILCDGCTFNATNGINLPENSCLNIYGQIGDSGEITAKSFLKTGIGSNNYTNSGNINIYGGVVNATGGDGDGGGSGIGGGYRGNGGDVSIYGGTVNATGGGRAAGIGGGDEGNGGTVTIYGGSVTATGSGYGAGIGGGMRGTCNEVTVYGGVVTATGGKQSAGIGGGYRANGGDITILGGNVTATCGEGAAAFGAGYGAENNGTLALGDTMALKAGDETPDTKMTPEEYYQGGYRYANIYEDILVKGENWFITGGGTLFITGEVQNTSTTTDYTPWKDYKSQIIAVVAKDGAKVTNCDRLFSNCANLKSVDIAKLNITGTTKMRYMFSGCYSIENLDLSTLDTSAVTNMQCMFYNDVELKSVNLDGFKTENVTDMQFMFRNCSALTALDLSDFNTAKVTTMNTMFSGCKNLEKLDISGFSREKLTNISGVLNGCTALEEIAVNGNALQKLASPISALASAWYNKENGAKYESEEQLQEIEGTVTLIKTPIFEFISKNLAFDSAFAFKFKGYLHDENPAADAYMEFRIGNIRTVYVPLSDAVKDENGRYVFTCYLNVLEVDEKIEAIFHDGDITVERQNPLSVSDYLNQVLEKHQGGTAEDTAVINLVNAISNYAHYAQIALDETHTEYEVGNGGKYVGTEARTAITLHTTDKLAQFAAVKNVADGFTDVTTTSRSLVLDDETAIVLYITPASESYEPTVKVIDKNGNDVAFDFEKQENGKYKVVIRGIAAHKLADNYTVDIDDGKLTYTNLSALSYAYSILSSSKSEAYKNAVSALYDYYLATVAYKN